jgi:hypothetical protein
MMRAEELAGGQGSEGARLAGRPSRNALFASWVMLARTLAAQRARCLGQKWSNPTARRTGLSRAFARRSGSP